MKAEEALRRAQKMEAIGQLTGGIAHDFNNLLTIIVGNIELLQRRLPEGSDRLLRAAEHAMDATRRAATLTQRLLAFSPRPPPDPTPPHANTPDDGRAPHSPPPPARRPAPAAPGLLPPPAPGPQAHRRQQAGGRHVRSPAAHPRRRGRAGNGARGRAPAPPG